MDKYNAIQHSSRNHALAFQQSVCESNVKTDKGLNKSTSSHFLLISSQASTRITINSMLIQLPSIQHNYVYQTQFSTTFIISSVHVL